MNITAKIDLDHCWIKRSCSIGRISNSTLKKFSFERIKMAFCDVNDVAISCSEDFSTKATFNSLKSSP